MIPLCIHRHVGSELSFIANNILSIGPERVDHAIGGVACKRERERERGNIFY